MCSEIVFFFHTIPYYIAEAPNSFIKINFIFIINIRSLITASFVFQYHNTDIKRPRK